MIKGSKWSLDRHLLWLWTSVDSPEKCLQSVKASSVNSKLFKKLLKGNKPYKLISFVNKEDSTLVFIKNWI